MNPKSKELKRLCDLVLSLTKRRTATQVRKGGTETVRALTVQTVVYLVFFHTKQHTVAKCLHQLIKVRIKCSFHTCTKSLLV